MTLHNVFYKSQSDTRSTFCGSAVVIVVGLVETFKDMLNVGRSNAIAIVYNTYYGMLVGLIEPYLNHALLLVYVFKGIGYQVVHHLLHLSLVVPTLYLVGCSREAEVDSLGACHILKAYCYVLYQFHKVVFAHTKTCIALFHLAEVEQLVYQTQHHAGILVYTLKTLCYKRVVLHVLHNIVEFGNDESQRRAELM